MSARRQPQPPPKAAVCHLLRPPNLNSFTGGYDFLDQLWNRLVGLIDQSELARLFGKTLLALLVLILILILAWVLRTSVRHLTDRASNNANLPILLSNLVYVGLLIVGALAIFSI